MSEFDFLDEVPSGKPPAEEFKDRRMTVLITESRLGGDYVLIPARSFSEFYPKGTVCFLPEEIDFMLKLNDHEAQMAYSLKKKMGGNLKIEKEQLCLETS